MNKKQRLSSVLFVLALAAALLTVVLSFSAAGGRPVMLSRPREAEQAVRQLLDAASAGDFEGIRDCLADHPGLGERQEPADEAGRLLWQSFLDSFTYEISGECYADRQGVALDVKVTYLDFDSVIPSLGKRTSRLLNRRVGQAKDMDEVYDENNDYREDVVREVLGEAVAQTLEAEGKTVTRDLTVHLTYDGDRWLVVPSGDVLSVISGGTVG